MDKLQFLLLAVIIFLIWGYVGRKIEKKEEKKQERNEEIKKKIEEEITRIFPSDKTDQELIALRRYLYEMQDLEKRRPEKYFPRLSLPPEYKSKIPEFFSLNSKSSFADNVIIISLSDIPGILYLPPQPIYAQFFEYLQNEQLLLEPTKPAPIKKVPPSWTQWTLSDKEQHFEEYKNEQYFLTLNKKGKLQQQINYRNEKLEALAFSAKEAFLSAKRNQKSHWQTIKKEYSKHAQNYFNKLQQEKDFIQSLIKDVNTPGKEGLLSRIDLTIKTLQRSLFISIEKSNQKERLLSTVIPDVKSILISARISSFISADGSTKFDPDSGILIHEHKFPDLATVQWTKLDEKKIGEKAVNQKEKKEATAKIFPALSLRLAAELARLDTEDIVKAIVINGWSDYVEKSTGKTKRAYCSSMFAYKKQILDLNLRALDPVAAFAALKGVAARNVEITPIAPIMRLDMNDSRFVDSKEVLANLVKNDNLAAMDWEDFEHLCRELFEKAFAGVGAEVKVTQASRDQGVDAIIFDPDPLRGGKIIVQAKRYTNSVEVSAVRDLYGAVINEGATKGILVTTSHYGPDAYAFSKDKPITLLNGSELLGLLEKYGYKFRINLAEAKLLK